MSDDFVKHLGWNRPLQNVRRGTSDLIYKIDLFIDFDWEKVIGHFALTFTNYLRLGPYVRKLTRQGRKCALVLTDQEGVPEGRRIDHETHDIFVLNVKKYKALAGADPAAAYFAGLRGAPIRTFSNSDTEAMALQLGLAGLADFAKALDVRFEGNSEPITEDEAQRAYEAIMVLSKYAVLPDSIELKLNTVPSQAIDIAQTISIAFEHSRRVEQLQLFENNLANDKEDFWHDFVSRNQWMFGHSLEFRYVRDLVDKPLISNKSIANKGGIMSDKELASEGELECTILLEIKTPAMKLVSDTKYREAIYPISNELAGALSQTLVERSRYVQRYTTIPDVREKWNLDQPLTFDPRTVLLAGNLGSLKGQQAETFNLFRAAQRPVEIITFDEMLRRAKRIIGCEALPKEH